MDSTILNKIILPAKFDMNAVNQCLRTHGVAVLPAWIQKATLAGLQEDWLTLRALKDRVLNSFFCYEEGEYGCINSILLKSKAMKRVKCFRQLYSIFGHEDLTAIANKIIGWPNSNNEKIYASYAVGKGGVVSRPHFDKMWNLKFTIYLDDVLDAESGALRFYLGSQVAARNKVRNLFDLQNSDHNKMLMFKSGDVPYDYKNYVDVFAPAGSLIIYNSDVFNNIGFLRKDKVLKIITAETTPGYLPIKNNINVSKNSRQWQRGESWELNNKTYSRFSIDGVRELFLDYKAKINL